MDVTFTETELAYLRGQHLGRLATVDSAGAPQNNPVGFFVDDVTGALVIAGTAMGKSRKYRNVRHNARVSLVVDDLASTNPWRVRGVEVRGTAEAQEDVDPPMDGLSRELIRITPRWIGSWGLPGQEAFSSRGSSGPMPRRTAQDAVRHLLDAYFQGFDKRFCEPAWLASIFSDEVAVRFPAGQAVGLDDLAQLSQQVLSLWAATLHQTSNHQVITKPGEAEFTAALTATHVHWPDDPGAHLRIGAQVSGTAVELQRGWRINSLAIDLVWREGDGPAKRDAD
ncbi:PPOX class F420-dependent oxidoreductase [Saccharopolyspora sp. 5N708]|uniref:PPOX class F420-dependent oxidoreductase n=1 Tax=Saccharopolyspora sp. 5N708 TaxID=3457424 RepID=UPI003FD50DFE